MRQETTVIIKKKKSEQRLKERGEKKQRAIAGEEGIKSTKRRGKAESAVHY